MNLAQKIQTPKYRIVSAPLIFSWRPTPKISGVPAVNYPDLLSAGKALLKGGVNFISIDDQKKPRGKWKHYQTERTADAELGVWCKKRSVHGLAMIGGEISGGLVIQDFDVPVFFERFIEKVKRHREVRELAYLLPIQQTGSGNYQMAFRCGLSLRNDKLAWVPADNVQGRETAIETRGEGGYAVVSPSHCPKAEKHGIKHKQAYKVIQGDFANIPTITDRQATILLDLARSLDEMPLTKKEMEAAPLPSNRNGDGTHGGVIEAFNAAFSTTNLLESHNYKRRGNRYLAPDSTSGLPGVHIFEDGRCYSHHANDPLNDGHSHDPFSVFTILEHGGDVRAAVKAAAETLGIKRTPPQEKPKPEPQAKAEAPKTSPQAGEPPAPAINPEIIITKRFLDDKSHDGIKALETANHPPFLFRRSGSLARISLDEKDHPRIETVSDVQLRGILARCARFLKETEKGPVATAPPMDLVKDILALGEWNFPALEGIIQAPAMRLDGTVLNQPGYDPKTRLYYVNPPDLFIPAIPENPSQEAVKESLGYLLEILCDFPFCEDPDRANALGLIITLPLRPAIPGNVPMAVITAPTPGTGKSLLQDTIAIIGTGKSAPMAGLPRDDDEMRKFITARMLAGDPFVSFDNLELPLWGPSLSRALTCTTWEDRILGGNTTARLPQRAVWVANGNNLKLRGDLPRRTFPIRLDARLTKPWERENFKHRDLIEWILRYRGDFLAAILTIARAWFVAGKPEPKKAVPVMGGFEAWAKTIGGILAFAGIDGFLENLKQFHDEADLEGPEWEGFLNAWTEAIGESAKTCQEVTAVLRDNSDFASTLPDNLENVLKDPEKSFERSLGRALAKKEKRPYGENNLALQRVGTHQRAVLWKVAPLSTE